MEEWTPEPLVQPQTAFEKEEAEKLPVIVGYVHVLLRKLLARRVQRSAHTDDAFADLPDQNPNSQTAEQSLILHPTTSTTLSETNKSKKKLSKPCERTVSDHAVHHNSTERKMYT